MTDAQTTAASQVENASGRDSMGKVVFASVVGTTVEWYDFFLYGSVAALIFGDIYFPSHSAFAGTMLALATYAVGFIARPLGGIVFGHFGDRLGRKKMLVVSLLMMGIATVGIGLVPSYASIGLAAPLILVVLRLVQGFAVGGEWGGAVLMISERGDPSRRGFWASWAQSGMALGQGLSVAVLWVMAATMEDAAFNSWGWRIAFLLSGVLVLVGLWIRLAMSDSPIFLKAQEEAAKQKEQKAPFWRVIRDYRPELLIAMGARFAENVGAYVLTVFTLTYATTTAGLERGDTLLAVLVGSVVQFASILFWGAVSDRVGRRPVLMCGAVGLGVWAFVAFPLIDTGAIGMMILAIAGGMLFHGMIFGPQASYFSELFGTSVRYSGASMGAQLASIVGGSVAPMVAMLLLSTFDSSVPVSIYMALAALVTIIAVAVGRETKNSDLDFERQGPAH